MNLKISEIEGDIEIYELSEEGGLQIVCKPDGRIELWLIPQYGGEPSFINTFLSIQEALSVGRTLT